VRARVLGVSHEVHSFLDLVLGWAKVVSTGLRLMKRGEVMEEAEQSIEDNVEGAQVLGGHRGCILSSTFPKVAPIENFEQRLSVCPRLRKRKLLNSLLSLQLNLACQLSFSRD